MARYASGPRRDGLDVGPPGPAVFVNVEAGELGEIVAAFVSDDGERFGLDAEAVRARQTLREHAGHDVTEERRALRAIATEW